MFPHKRREIETFHWNCCIAWSLSVIFEPCFLLSFATDSFLGIITKTCWTWVEILWRNHGIEKTCLVLFRETLQQIRWSSFGEFLFICYYYFHFSASFSQNHIPDIFWEDIGKECNTTENHLILYYFHACFSPWTASLQPLFEEIKEHVYSPSKDFSHMQTEQLTEGLLLIRYKEKKHVKKMTRALQRYLLTSKHGLKI